MSCEKKSAAWSGSATPEQVGFLGEDAAVEQLRPLRSRRVETSTEIPVGEVRPQPVPPLRHGISATTERNPRKKSQSVSRARHELGIPPGPPQRGEQVLHRLRPRLALHRLPLPGHGVRGGGREGLGRRAEGLQVQHGSARLPQRLLRPLLPRVPRAAVGAAAHLRHLPLAAGDHARGVQGGTRAQEPPQVRRELPAALPEPGEEARRPVVDLRPHPHLQNRRGHHLRLPPLPHLRGLRLPQPHQVRAEALPQQGGLLHRAAHREEDLHHLHGGHQPGLHPPLALRDHLPGGQAVRRVLHRRAPVSPRHGRHVQREHPDGRQHAEGAGEEHPGDPGSGVQPRHIVRGGRGSRDSKSSKTQRRRCSLRHLRTVEFPLNSEGPAADRHSSSLF